MKALKRTLTLPLLNAVLIRFSIKVNRRINAKLPIQLSAIVFYIILLNQTVVFDLLLGRVEWINLNVLNMNTQNS